MNDNPTAPKGHKDYVVVDREQFIAWSEGVLLDITPDHHLVVDEQACIKADEALQRGETIFTVVDQRLFSTLTLNEEEEVYAETLLS